MSLIVGNKGLFLLVGSMTLVMACTGRAVDPQTPQSASGNAPALGTASAERGEGVYVSRCVMCHGESLAGGGHIPALTGDRFRKDWGGRTWRNFYGQTISTMPWTNPGSLTEQEALDATLYIAARNGEPVTTPVTTPQDLTAVVIKPEG